MNTTCLHYMISYGQLHNLSTHLTILELEVSTLISNNQPSVREELSCYYLFKYLSRFLTTVSGFDLNTMIKSLI